MPGEVKSFSELNDRIRVPHVGWNEAKPVKVDPMIKGLLEDSRFYFVHSYRLTDSKDDIKICKTVYQDEFISFVEKENIYGSQFHPEKSHLLGLKLINNFLEIKN